MAKTDGKSSRLSTRFPSTLGAGTSTLAEDEVFDGTAASFYRPSARKPASGRPYPGDSPFREDRSDLPDDGEPFLRSSRRVAVRRGVIPKGRWGRIGFAAGAVLLAGGLTWLGVAGYRFAAHDPRFRIDSSENIQVLGNAEVTQPELLSVFGADMGRNVFFVPLKERRAELERLPWVEQATVMRLLPDQLRVTVAERTPIAFVRNGNTIGLVDHQGVLLPIDPKTLASKHYSFPVVTGISANDPPSTREARMKLYQRFIAELDAGGEKVSSQLSEVDLSNPEDVKALVPSQGSDLLLHFGDQDFLPRWRNYQQHLAEWKQQYPRLASIDLRYERQVVLEMEKGAAIAPGEDAAGKTTDGLKADASSISPAPAKQGDSAAAHNAAAKRNARPGAHTTKQGRN